MKIIAIFYRDSKRIRKVITTNKQRLSQICSLTRWDRIDLRVMYGKGMKNEGSYTTKAEFRLALNAFTEK